MENKNMEARKRALAGYPWRDTKEEFIAEGAMMKALYEKVEELLIKRGDGSYSAQRVLRIFNYANNIFWQLTNLGEDKPDTQYVDTERNPNVRIMTYSLTFVLLKMFGMYSQLSEAFKEQLHHHKSDNWAWELMILAEQYETDKPEPHPAPKAEPVDFDTTLHQVTAALAEAQRLKQENESLRHKLEEEKKRREHDVKHWKALNNMQADTMSALLLKHNAVEQKLAAWENNKFYQAVNIGTIVDYAQGQKENKLDVIKMMLLELCANKVDNDVLQKIKDLRSGGTFNIDKVGQMYPNATHVENHYHTPPKDETND